MTVCEAELCGQPECDCCRYAAKRINELECALREAEIIRRKICSIASIQMDWYVGITASQEAMIEITNVLDQKGARSAP